MDYLKQLQQEPIIIESCNNNFVSPHSHPFFEFVYVVSGKAEHTIDGHTSMLCAGDYFLINLKSSHSYRRIGEDKLLIINFLFLPEFIDRTLSDASSLQEILNNYLVRFGYHRFSDRVTSRAYHDTDGFIGTLALNMQNEYREKRAGYAEILRNSLISMLVYLVRNDTESGMVENITGYLKEYAENHYIEPIALTSLAKELHYSLTHVSLTFKKDMQLTFREYVQRLRMDQACRLLRVTDKNVAEIATLVGYADPAFFYKTFRKVLGVTPRAYRKQNQNVKSELIVK